jgi:hypothetical protein
VVACREIGVGLMRYIQYVVPRAVVGAIPPLALLWWFKLGLDVRGFVGLLSAGSAMLLLFGVTWIFFVYRNDPFVNLQPRLVRFRAWSRA